MILVEINLRKKFNKTPSRFSSLRSLNRILLI
jgi:hypothetical protein